MIECIICIVVIVLIVVGKFYFIGVGFIWILEEVGLFFVSFFWVVSNFFRCLLFIMFLIIEVFSGECDFELIGWMCLSYLKWEIVMKLWGEDGCGGECLGLVF